MKKHLLAVLILFSAIHLNAQDINLYADSIHAPFIYGVASGDPTDTSIILWTALADDTTNTPQTIVWQLAADSNFVTIVKSGSGNIDRSNAYAFKTDVSGLQPYSKYFYRFSNGGHWSVTGLTETAPTQNVDSLKFAIVSCSSLFSGYFNAYRQLAFNRKINAIIHVGDFIYNFPDPQERIRIPQPEPPNPVSLEDWRNRYRLYMLDPDLREARRVHPWIEVWDNHDIDIHKVAICAEAYLQFNPVRLPSNDSTRIWRKFHYGPMVDVFVVDDYQYAGQDTFADGSPKMLLNNQYNWLVNSLDSSQAIWKIIAVSKLFNHWELGPFAGLIPGGLNNSWEGYPESRDSLLTFIAQHHVNNPVIVSGDLHMNIVSDLALNPFDSTAYSRETGTGGIGIEVNGASISRGNLDESGISQSNGPSFYAESKSLNPQQRYLNFFDNGYNLLTFNNDSLTARMMLCPILQITDAQRMDTILFCRVNDNHWLRTTPPSGILEPVGQISFQVYPNPTIDKVWKIKADARLVGSRIEVMNQSGQIVFSKTLVSAEDQLQFDSAAGIYFIRVISDAGVIICKAVKL